MTSNKKLATLTYFNIRGRAEPIRLVLEELQIPYNDNQIQMDEWYQIKPKFPFEQLPVYEEKLPSGKRTIPQTHAILRYLARKYNLYGKSEDEIIRCDVVQELGIEVSYEIAELIWDPKFKELRDEFVNKKLPYRLSTLEKCLKENNNTAHWVGNGFTFVDAIMWAYLEIVRAISNDTLKKYSALMEFKQKFEARPNIAAYLKSGRRPPTYTVPFAYYCNTPETS